MCEMTRLISQAITRSTVQRGVLAMPMSRSAGRGRDGTRRPAPESGARARPCACSLGERDLGALAPAQALPHVFGEFLEGFGDGQLLHRVVRLGVGAQRLAHLLRAAEPAPQ